MSGARAALRELRAPDEAGAQMRAWSVISSAYSTTTRPAAHRSRRAVVVAPVVAVVLGALVLSPAGASVRRWISRALGITHAMPALFSLPAHGTLLVSGTGGTWTVAADGAARRLGSWRQAVWSPRALYAAVAEGDQVAAVDPRGTVRWMLSRPAVRDPSWYSPTGFRIAYLSRHELRVVAGDGTGDHLVATGIASVAPAWESGHPYDLAYVAGRRQVVVRDTATGAVRWRVTPRDRPLALSWSDDGTELMVAARHHVSVYGQSGRLLLALPSAGREPVHDAALSPDGHTLAVLAGGDSQALDVIPLRGRPSRQLLSGEGLGALSWSPDGRWLLVSWPAADQWVFVRVHGGPRILAVSHIRRQLASGEATFPRVDGWCCAGPSH